MKDISLQFLLDLRRVKIARQNLASDYTLNIDMNIECKLLQAEIDELDKIIGERYVTVNNKM